MSLRFSFQLMLLCCFFLASLTPGNAVGNIIGSDGNDSLIGTSGNDEIIGGKGDDILVGNDGDDVLYGGKGDDVLRGDDGDDVLHGGLGVDRLYGGPGADQFVFVVDTGETDEVMDFNPEQNDTIFLRRKYFEMDTNTTTHALTGENVRIDDDGNVEVQLRHEDWARIVKLNEHNLELNSRELTGGLQLFFIRRF